MSASRCLGLLVVFVFGATYADAQVVQIQPIQPKNPFADVPTTHKQVADIKVRSSDGKHALQTIGIDAEGRVLALTSAPKSFGLPVKGIVSEVHIFTADAKPAGVLKVDFHANSVAGGPDGSIYVAGDGKVVKFDNKGKQLAIVDLPHMKELLSDESGMRKRAEDQLKL